MKTVFKSDFLFASTLLLPFLVLLNMEISLAVKVTATYLSKEENQEVENNMPSPEDHLEPCEKNVKECYETLMRVYAPKEIEDQDKLFFTCVDEFKCKSFKERTCMENSEYKMAHVTEKCKKWKMDRMYETRYKINLYKETVPPRFPD